MFDPSKMSEFQDAETAKAALTLFKSHMKNQLLALKEAFGEMEKSEDLTEEEKKVFVEFHDSLVVTADKMSSVVDILGGHLIKEIEKQQ